MKKVKLKPSNNMQIYHEAEPIHVDFYCNQHVFDYEDNGHGVLNCKPEDVETLKSLTTFVVEDDKRRIEFSDVEWTDEIKEDHRVLLHFTWLGERFISANMLTQREKEIDEIRRSRRTASKPGAVLTVQTMKLPARIQKNIEEALRNPWKWFERR